MNKEYVMPSKDLLIKNSERDDLEDRYYRLSKLLFKKDLNEKLLVPIGIDDKKEKCFVDLSEISTMLIGGETGSGKSVLIDSIIVSLLLKNTPDNLKFVFIDPKKIELFEYDGIPHIIDSYFDTGDWKNKIILITIISLIALSIITVITYNLLTKSYTTKLSYSELFNKIENDDSFVLVISKSVCRYCSLYIPKIKKIAKYADANGNVLFLKAREVSAVQDISNAEDTSFTSLDYDETRFCDYLSAGRQTTRGLYVSEESTGENTLIHDKETKNEMKNEENFALSAIKGEKTTAEIDAHYDELMQTGLTYTASGVNTAYLGEGSNTIISQNGASSSKLDEFINKVKTSNEGANKLDSYAKSKNVNKTQRKLIDEAWEEMDKEKCNELYQLFINL